MLVVWFLTAAHCRIRKCKTKRGINRLFPISSQKVYENPRGIVDFRFMISDLRFNVV